MRNEIHDRYRDNIARVSNLVGIYEKLGTGTQGRRPVNSTDLLRAATVLLHSALEDYLRGLARWKWPHAGQPVLDTVPLIGTSPTGRADKFLLGSLAPYRKKKVQRVIRDSVNSYLDRFTISDTGDIAKVLESVNVKVQDVNGQFANLLELMRRRHHIVHQGDRNPRRGQGQHRAQSLGTWQVRAWIDSVEDFVQQTDVRVAD